MILNLNSRKREITVATVYVPQEPLKRDPHTGAMRTFMDLSDAARFGEITILLPSGASMFQAQPMVNAIRQKMQGFSDDDFILCVGDPSAIGIAVAMAAKYNRGKVKILKWDRKARSYITQEVTI
jgi:ABC-type sugar transport system substrate-binding protein